LYRPVVTRSLIGWLVKLERMRNGQDYVSIAAYLARLVHLLSPPLNTNSSALLHFNMRRLAGVPVVVVFLLSACGGGGGSSSPTITTFSIGGTVSGLASAASVVLQNSGSSTTVSANGSFSFPKGMPNSASYAVTIFTQPIGQTCTVTSGSGVVSAANVTSVHVTCVVNTYTISGTLSGLAIGATVTLRNNGSDTNTVHSNGAFAFTTPISYNGRYLVTVARQPPAQLCVVTAGVGAATANVSGVTVTCGPATESVIHSFGGNPDGVGP
jgi:hypothetical protein